MDLTDPAAVDGLQAIDTHVHVEVSSETGRGSLPPELEKAADAYFGVQAERRPTADEIANYYRERSLAAVVFTVDATTNLGTAPIDTDEIVAAAARHPDVLIPFGTVDPLQGQAAVEEAERQIVAGGVRGFKLHPGLQGFHPNDRTVYPLYEVIAQHGRVALFHTGQTGIGAGVPGGAGIRLKYSNPLALDDVAADFPDLDIILAHPSFPWQDEALAVATHKPRIHIDLSGWSPRYFPPQLVRYANTLLQDRMLFGSDYPLITPDRWLKDFAAIDIKDEVRPKILKWNAARLLGLSGGSGSA